MFDRLELLIGKKSLNKLNNTHVLVIGLGGVGGYVVESLVRSGIGTITIVDSDTIDISNINRQIIATRDNIGKLKTEEFKKRIKSIRDDIKINIISEFIDESNIDLLFDKRIDFLVDAQDTIDTKCLIITKCLDKNIDFITSMGTGNRMNPLDFEIVDLKKTKNDPVARILRKYIKDNNIEGKINCLCSKELPIRRGKVIASNSFVPPTAGLIITSYIVNKIWEENK